MNYENNNRLIAVLFILLNIAIFAWVLFGCESKECPKQSDKTTELLDSIHTLNAEVFILTDANNYARAGIYRYAGLQSLNGLNPDEVIFQILHMGITATPYQERDSKFCDEAFNKVTEGR